MHTIERAKKTLSSYRTVRQLSLANVSDEYNPTVPYFSRSLLWRLQLITNYENSAPELTPANSPADRIDVRLDRLQSSRRAYAGLLNDFPVPWDQLDPGSEYYSRAKDADEFDIGATSLGRTRVEHDPLSSQRSPRMTDLNALQAIVTDVERLFPQMPAYFIRNLANKRAVVEILFVWWKLHGDTYQQGLHEIAGLVFVELYKEALDPVKLQKKRKDGSEIVELDVTDTAILELYDVNHLKADVYHIFARIVARPYELYYGESSLLEESIKFNLKLHRCDRYHFVLLNNKLKIEPSIWLIRYYRLLLLRELGVDSSLPLWDKMVSFGYVNKRKEPLDTTLLLPYIVIILLSLIRPETMQSDYGEVMYLLLHYPVQTRNERTNKSVRFSNDIDEDEDDNHHIDDDLVYDEDSADSDVSGSPRVEIDPNVIITDAIVMYNSEPELETVGKMVVERYAAIHARIPPVERTNSLMSLMRRSSGSFRRRSGSGSEDSRRSPAKLQPEKAYKHPDNANDNSKKPDFERTRLEMRLQRKVSKLMNK
ncbi:unnamed protein product [Kuraishia capsulata CBS 1993]|uniref:Rab-GAP TBC domain-containing protein n=1 Tax=Kuraishia capsulata CBS 1993 TaxID=1382522 RepID=W6MJ52_9ASCO|nr:uncharacterized protein KUCA_T00001959001 [Kuraishia capsulata CBS 1993]CDK25988.1 unnamed protein product [Kuraishia capsulata CBS 1993]